MKDLPISKTLVFVVHGLRGNKEKLKDLKKLLKEAYPDCDPEIPELPHRSLFSIRRAPQIVRDIIRRIDDIYNAGDFDRLILVGHSMGAVLARRALIEASGVPGRWSQEVSSGSKLENDLQHVGERPWAAKVERLVMLASISRGWSAKHTRSPLQSFQWKLGGMIGHLLPKGMRPTLFDFRLGSPFIVQTRLRWLDFCQHIEERPQVVQFLGTKDDVAPPDDSVDFAMTHDSDRFIQVELPHSSHSSLLRFYPSPNIRSSEADHMLTRQGIVKGVLRDHVETYERYLVRREWFVDELPSPLDRSVKHLIFVLHGIRDRGFWTKKIAAGSRRKRATATSDLCRAPQATVISRFCRFSCLGIDAKRLSGSWITMWKQPQCIQRPICTFWGIPNGTYLAARALQDYPMVSFKRIFFAGSVVRRNYDWNKLVSSGRVKKIFNVVATADWVVAIFPNGLRPLQSFFDLGGAGHVGFRDAVPGALYQMDHSASSFAARDYVHGGHSAGRDENLWDEIAEFFVNGDEIPPGQNPHFKPNQPLFWRVIGFISPLIVTCIATVIIGVGLVSLWAAASSIDLLDPPTWANDSWLTSNWFSLSIPRSIIRSSRIPRLPAFHGATFLRSVKNCTA